MKYKITLRRTIRMLSVNIYNALYRCPLCVFANFFTRSCFSLDRRNIQPWNHELRSRTVFMTLARRWQFIITSHTGIACNLRHVLQFTGLLSVSFALNFPISLSRAIRNPFRSNVQCPPAKHGLSRISANPLITLLSDAWRNDVASGAESRCITRPMRCLVADGNNRVWHARV